jgi:hypothetical protein
MFFVVCCVLLCVQDEISCLGWVSAIGSYSKYDILYYDIVLGVVELDTCAILVKYLARENGGREKNDKSVVCVFSQRQI